MRWVVCRRGMGHLGSININKSMRHFPINSVGLVEQDQSSFVKVWLIGKNQKWWIPSSDIEDIDLSETGDKFDKKVCNECHRLLQVDEFDKNQTNKHGVVRRPSCRKCRTNIDKRPPKSRQAKSKEKERPKKGDPFTCPICSKQRIAGITVKVVADHDHHTGDIRDFICDSCNTGLGRFKNGENYLKNAIAYIKDHSTLG